MAPFNTEEVDTDVPNTDVLAVLAVLALLPPPPTRSNKLATPSMPSRPPNPVPCRPSASTSTPTLGGNNFKRRKYALFDFFNTPPARSNTDDSCRNARPPSSTRPLVSYDGSSLKSSLAPPTTGADAPPRCSNKLFAHNEAPKSNVSGGGCWDGTDVTTIADPSGVAFNAIVKRGSVESSSRTTTTLLPASACRAANVACRNRTRCSSWLCSRARRCTASIDHLGRQEGGQR